MGSSGSGRFGTYRIGGGLGGDGGVINQTGGSTEVECPRIIENIRLEDVATSEFYLKHKTLPVAKSVVKIKDKVYLGRLVVETGESPEVIGNLPTQYNYLLTCIQKGINYAGQVVSSGETPVPFVVVQLNA